MKIDLKLCPLPVIVNQCQLMYHIEKHTIAPLM